MIIYRLIFWNDNENIYVLGNATNRVYKYSLDNTHDNIYVRLGGDIDNDNTIDNYSDWILVPENGYITSVNLPDSYNWNVSFRLESDSSARTPKIGSFTLNVDYHREWINVENWVDNLNIYERNWESNDIWTDRILIETPFEPLTDIQDLIVSFILPFFILFGPALILMTEFGVAGFLGGMSFGALLVYVVCDFSFGSILLILSAIVIVWWKHEEV